MKAYVIKRDDGKYLSKYNNYNYRVDKPRLHCWTVNIINAKRFKQVPITSYKCVPIIIIEGDENAKTVEALERMKEKSLLFCVNDTPKLTGHYVSTKIIDQLIKEYGGKNNVN